MTPTSTIATLALLYVHFVYSYVNELQLLVLLSLLYMLLPTAAESKQPRLAKIRTFKPRLLQPREKITSAEMINAGLTADSPVEDIAELLNERLRFETGINRGYVRSVMDQFDGDFNQAKAYVHKIQQEMVEKLTRNFKLKLEPEMATALLVGFQWNYYDVETLALNYINWKESVVRQFIKKISPTIPLFANEWYDFRRLDKTVASLIQKQNEMRMQLKNRKSCYIHIDVKMYKPTPSRHIRMKFSVNETLSDEGDVGSVINFSLTDETNVHKIQQEMVENLTLIF
jgi:hypothetical protein